MIGAQDVSNMLDSSNDCSSGWVSSGLVVYISLLTRLWSLDELPGDIRRAIIDEHAAQTSPVRLRDAKAEENIRAEMKRWSDARWPPSCVLHL